MSETRYYAIENNKIKQICQPELNNISLIDLCFMVNENDYLYKRDANTHTIYKIDKETAIEECNAYINACKREEYSNIKLTYKDVLNDIREQLK